MKAKNIEGDWEIRPEPGGKVWCHLSFGALKLTFIIPAADAKTIAAAFNAAARVARKPETAEASIRIAARLLKKASRP